jgi:hypothetical protein
MPHWVVRLPAVGRRIMQSMTVPYSFISHLFEAFRATKRDGMGLGLTICQSIAKAHGGELRYEPNLGGGPIFRFTPRGSDQWPLKESSTPVDYCTCSLAARAPPQVRIGSIPDPHPFAPDCKKCGHDHRAEEKADQSERC